MWRDTHIPREVHYKPTNTNLTAQLHEAQLEITIFYRGNCSHQSIHHRPVGVGSMGVVHSLELHKLLGCPEMTN